MKRLVLVGGGHAHIEVLRGLASRRDPRRAVTLVTPSQRLIYSGMVPGVVAGHYAVEDCAIDLVELARRAEAELLLTTASLVSADAGRVACSDGSVLGYDVLSLDVGSTPVIGAARGVERHAVPMRPLERLLVAWNGVVARARAGEIRAITVVGGGAAGVEMALAMRHRLERECPGAAPHVRLLSDAPGVGIAGGAGRRLLACLRRAGVECQLNALVKEVGAGYVRVEGGLEFATDSVFWATGAAAHGWIRDSGLPTDDRGFLLTNLRLQAVTYANIFGAGDCATVEGHVMPKAGVFAVRAAPTLAANLLAALDGGELAEHVPDPRFLALIATGRRHAVGTWGRWSWQGRWAWRWKDRIDRRFMRRYARL